MKRACLFIFVCIISAVTLRAQSAPDHPITLREALELMRLRSPALLAGRQHLEATRANETTAGLRPNPLLTSANEDFNVFNPSQFDIANKQEFTDNISQLIERGHKRQLRVASARGATLLAQDDYRDSQRQLEFQVKSSFVAMLLAKADLQLAQDNLQDYQATVQLNETRLKAGDISPTDFDRIRIEQARFESDLLAAQLGVNQARMQLETLLGFADLGPQFDIAGDLSPPNLPLSLDELEKQALGSRPDYQAARDAVGKAESDARLAVADGATDFAVGGEYKRNGPDNTLGFTVQLPLRFFDRNQGEKLRTQQEVQASHSAEKAAELAVRSDVAQAYQSYLSALLLSHLYSQDYLARAKSVRDHIEFSFRHGGASLLDYLDAVRSYRDVELAARASYAQALVAIHQLSLVTATELWP